MDREKFLKEFNELKESGDFRVRTPDEIRELARQNVKYLSPPDKPVGYQQLAIAIEELSELTQRVTKSLRGKYDKISLIEEFADVIIAQYYIETVLDMSFDDIAVGLEVKLRKIERLISEAKNRDPNEPFKEEWL